MIMQAPHSPHRICVIHSVFVLRWYGEVDKDGKELEGYQNKDCAGYKLLANNVGACFAWTSNFQIISKVFPKKHVAQPRTYTLNKKDVKMLGTAVTKKAPRV